MTFLLALTIYHWLTCGVNHLLTLFSTDVRFVLMKGHELKDWREKHGLTQDRLAELLKVAKNTISRWERGERSIPEYMDLALEALEARLKTS